MSGESADHPLTLVVVNPASAGGRTRKRWPALRVALKAAGVAVVRIDSTRTAKERAADLAAVREGTIKLVMITPESVNSP